MGLINWLLNSDSRKSLKKLDKTATEVELLEPKYAAMSEEELKGQTAILKQRLQNGETTDDILCDAFAVAREAAWRVLNMKHYHVQIIGGICLYQGRIAEMKTGEGKTLVATLPAYLNALKGKGVHIVTVNDYLASRDAEWMGKVHRFLNLSVGVVVPGMDDDAKRRAYACDITYATNNELGFDYLRDNLKTDITKMMQRGLDFAIVDEVDSILIDEARTPLIISGKGDKSSELYEKVDRFVRNLKGGYDDEIEAPDFKNTEKSKSKAKKKLVIEENENANEGETASPDEEEAEHVKPFVKSSGSDWDYVIDRKARTVHITESGAEKAERYFGIENLGDVENAQLNHHIQQALKAHKLFFKDEQYVVNDGEILIVDEFTGRLMIGRRYSDGLHQAIEAKEGVSVRNENKTYATITFQNFFRLYNKLSGMTGTAKTEEGEFKTIYNLDVLEIPTNRQVVRKDANDRIYSTEDAKKRSIIKEIAARHELGQPVLVGTVTVEKSEEIAKALRKTGIKHNILNAKNHAREAEIVAQAGRFGAVTIATNMAGRGTDILLGGNPEYMAKKRLREENVEHELIERATSFAELDAEAEAVRERYRTLYAEYKTETDAEKAKVISVGGLCIIGTERHESRRIDNQLRGRAGRQGDPGASVFFISLEDDLAIRFGGDRLKKLYSIFGDEDVCLEARMLSRAMENAQKSIEGRNFGIRKSILQYDDVMNKQREVMYAERMKVLRGEDVHQQLLKYIPDYVKTVLYETVDVDALPENWDVDKLNEVLESKLLPEGTSFITQDKLNKWDLDTAIDKISKKTENEYEKKISDIQTQFNINYGDIERRLLLMNVDRNWIDHIDAMDQLRKGIGLRSYANVDPIIAYKSEGYEMFDEMIARIQDGTISAALKLKVEVNKPQVAPKAPTPQQMVANRAPDGVAKPATSVTADGIDRNGPCPCGSGKRYKHCCGRK